MTAASVPPQPAVARRSVDILGIVAVCVSGLLLVPSLFVFLIGLIPSMNAIWWLGLALIPLCAIAGGLAVLLAVIGIIVAVRRTGRFVLSIIGLVLGILLLLPVSWLFFSSLAVG